MINIKEKFLQLTSNRTPKGREDSVISLIPEFKFEKDEFDNYYYIIKKEDGTYSNTMFTSHLDTIDRVISLYSCGRKWNSGTNSWDYPNGIFDDKEKSIKHVFDGDFIKTDGKTNLGADDKAGVVIMLNLMSSGVPGLYYFFMGEESGCVGSSNLSRVFESKVKENKLPKVNKCISFDRKGYDSVITRQMSSDCCSEEFAKELSEKLNEYGFWFKPDSGGVYTDSAEFIDIIPECTNLSVGYFNEHTTSEKQDIEFLELLSVVLTKIDWETLKITRDVSNVKYKGKKSSYGGYGGCGGYGSDWDDGFYDRRKKTTTTKSLTYVDKGNGELSKIDDTEFDKWYKEQKDKNWDIENAKVVI